MYILFSPKSIMFLNMGFISKGSMLVSTLARGKPTCRVGCLHTLCTGGLPCSSPRGTWLSRSLTAAVCAQGPASNTQFNTCKWAYFRNLVFKKMELNLKNTFLPLPKIL